MIGGFLHARGLCKIFGKDLNVLNRTQNEPNETDIIQKFCRNMNQSILQAVPNSIFRKGFLVELDIGIFWSL